MQFVSDDENKELNSTQKINWKLFVLRAFRALIMYQSEEDSQNKLTFEFFTLQNRKYEASSTADVSTSFNSTDVLVMSNNLPSESHRILNSRKRMCSPKKVCISWETLQLSYLLSNNGVISLVME